MKNIPFFTTEFGVASLILEEIPYRKEAYIRIQSTEVPQLLLDECIRFCKAVGADTVYATGDPLLEQYPVFADIVLMQCDKVDRPASGLRLCQANEDTISQWCDIYNSQMKNVSFSATLSVANFKSLLKNGGCYFVYENENIIGLGKIGAEKVEAIISLVRGRGEDIMRMLCSVLDGHKVFVEVSSNNLPALSLYNKMGFVAAETITSWHCVYKG